MPNPAGFEAGALGVCLSVAVVVGLLPCGEKKSSYIMTDIGKEHSSCDFFSVSLEIGVICSQNQE